MVLLERERPVCELTTWWSDACEGRGCAVLIAGEAGIGKTAVVRELERQVAGRKLLGICDPLSTPRPLGPLVDIAPQIGGTVARQLGARKPVDMIFAALVAELAAAAVPTLIVIEDAHWADASSLDLLRFLGRRIGRLRAMLLVTFRPEECGPGHPLRITLGDLASSDAIRKIALEPLTIEGVRALAAGNAIDAADLHRRSAGNPFFVTEVLAEPGPAVPATVRDAVMSRMSRLADDERAALEATAVLGARVRSQWVDAMVCGKNALASSLVRGLVHADGELVTFRHELARDAVLAADPRVRREELAALAHHAEGAADPVAAREYGVAAAREASRLRAHRQAAQQYERAQRWFPADDSRAYAELVEAHAHERYLTDEVTRAIELRLQAAEMWQRLGDHVRIGDNLRWLSRVSWFAGRTDDAWKYARRAIETLQPHSKGRELAAAYSNQAQLHMLAEEAEAAVRWGNKAIALARRIGDVEIESHARNNVGSARAFHGDLTGLRQLERSLALAREAQLDEHVARALTNLTSVLVETRDLAGARPILADGLAFTEAHDLDAWYLYLRGQETITQLHSGQLSEAIEGSLRVLGRPGLSLISRILPLVVLGRARARRGDPDVWLPLDEALGLAERARDMQRIGPVRLARAEAAWLAGDSACARREVHEALPQARRLRAPWLAGELMFMLALAGEPVDPPSWVARPFALFLRRRFVAAAEAWAALGCPYERAWSIAADRSETGLRTAFQMLERLGMPAAAMRAADHLRLLGARKIPRGRRAANRGNAGGLTRRELEVLQLIAEGLRNAEIGIRLSISPKTVDHHISAILGKIKVADRFAAARWYHEHSAPRDPGPRGRRPGP